jgi:spore germination cell wall hydrolase CwlJ-like protein
MGMEGMYRKLQDFASDENEKTDFPEAHERARKALVNTGGSLVGAGLIAGMSPTAEAAGNAPPTTIEQAIEEDTQQRSEAALTCLADNVYNEARGESIEGQLAVALVTLSRTLFPEYPKDVCGVVYQKNQFSWTFDPKILMTAVQEKEMARIRELVAPLLQEQDIATAVTFLSAALGLPKETLYYKRVGFQGSAKVQQFFGSLRSVGVIGRHEFFVKD